MIADDTNAIREGMRKLAQAKAQAAAEAARKAAADASAADLPAQRPLFQEPGAPFRGFFVTEDGDIRPSAIARRDSNFDTEAWDEWDRDDWDNVNLDSGVTEKTLPLFMYGHLCP
jgi:hypothetical protein